MNVARLRAPIVLVHGLFGFDQVCFGPWLRLHYFHGIPGLLEAGGNRVLVARLSPTHSIAARAAQLKAFILAHSPDQPVHLFAHSMGGLDSRFMISRLDMAAHVLSLTTLGTPHRGSPFADWALSSLVPLVLPVFEMFNLPRQAFTDLTVGSCRQFNLETPDSPGVRYFSVAGRCHLSWLNPSWQLTGRVVEKQEGPSDGVVSVQSATWGESCEVWPGDHFHLVNWPIPRLPSSRHDRRESYAALVERLAREGY